MDGPGAEPRQDPEEDRTRPWAAEYAVPGRLARELIEDQFPALVPARVEPLGIGWDNTAFLVNGAHVFRFPRRQIAVECLEAELRVLGAIAPRLPLPVPLPEFAGQPGNRYPWPFAGHRWIPGRTACIAAPGNAERHAAARPLGRFLAALHAIGAEEAAHIGAGPDTLGRLDPGRTLRARENLVRIARLGLLDSVAPLERVLDETARSLAGSSSKDTGDRPPGRWTLVHGDLYARHLIVGEEAGLAGVIDWGDVHVGDPAIDLSIAHGFLPPAARDIFLRAYGSIDDATWSRARWRALCHATVVACHAHATGDGTLLGETLIALGHVAAG